MARNDQVVRAAVWVPLLRQPHSAGVACSIHGKHTDWWQRSGELICNRCHINPADITPAQKIAPASESIRATDSLAVTAQENCEVEP